MMEWQIAPDKKYLRLEQRVLSRTLSEIVFIHEDYPHAIGTASTCGFCKEHQKLQKQLQRNSKLLAELSRSE